MASYPLWDDYDRLVPDSMQTLQKTTKHTVQVGKTSKQAMFTEGRECDLALGKYQQGYSSVGAGIIREQLIPRRNSRNRP